MFSVYGGKCSSCKAIHNCVEKFSQGHSEVAVDARPGAELAETTVKRSTGKEMEQVYQRWRRMCLEISVFFQIQILQILRFISICDLFTDSSS
jgi:hypothetical protein